MLQRAVGVMSAIGVSYQQSRVESGQASVSNYTYWMDPYVTPISSLERLLCQTNFMCRPLDALTTYQTACQSEPAAPTRYAIRQALDQEYQKFQIQRDSEIRQARYKAGNANFAVGDEDATRYSQPEFPDGKDSASADGRKVDAPKRDFFGRVVDTPSLSSADGLSHDNQAHRSTSKSGSSVDHTLVWITFNEGFSNAVRKPVTIVELFQDF